MYIFIWHFSARLVWLDNLWLYLWGSAMFMCGSGGGPSWQRPEVSQREKWMPKGCWDNPCSEPSGKDLILKS